MKRDSKARLIELKAGHPIYRGYVLSRGQDRKYLLRDAIPNETVLAELVEQRKDYAVAITREVLEPSPWRTNPLCPYYGTCGGCHYQHISYEKQLEIKGQILQDCLGRIAKIDQPLLPAFLGHGWNYRYRASIKVKDGIIGFYRANTRDIVGVKNCFLLRAEINNVLSLMDKIRWAVFSGQIEISGGMEPLIALLPDKTVGRALSEGINRGLNELGLNSYIYSHGAPPEGLINLNLCGTDYTVRAMGFFQANWELNNKVVAFLAEHLDLRGKRVIDLYCGAGNFSLVFAGLAGSVIGYEENPLAVSDAKRNATLRGLTNCQFIHSRAEDIQVSDVVDLVVINPPRPGLTKRAIERLIALNADVLIYLSCDPATFSRDLGRLKGLYQIESVRLIDFFPQTYHIEALGILRKRH